jgi:hypothetical protein
VPVLAANALGGCLAFCQVLLLLDTDTEKQWTSTLRPAGCLLTEHARRWNPDIAFGSQKTRVDKLRKQINDDANIDEEKMQRIEGALETAQGELTRWGQCEQSKTVRAHIRSKRQKVKVERKQGSY